MEQMTLTVKGMTCGGCENAVKRVLTMLDGVADVTASHRESRVTVTFDTARTTPAAIHQAIETAGYRVEGAAG